MKIDKLTVSLSGPAGSGHAFARQFTQALAELQPAQGSAGRIANIQVPQLQARPGESQRQMARRAAVAVAQSLNAAKGRSQE